MMNRVNPLNKRKKISREKLTDRILTACKLLENDEEIINFKELAQAVGVSPYHFHRLFKEATGLTPKSYAKAHQASRVRKELISAETVTHAIYNAGYSSSSRFYETAEQFLGMNPKAYRAGGLNVTIHFAIGQCSLGAILVAMSQKGICAISLGDDAQQLICELQDQFPNANLVGDDKQFAQLIAQVVGFIESPHQPLDLPLDIQGTLFQQRVWQALRAIPLGSTLSYTELAKQIGCPSATRAAASACAANKLAIAIPCHRVIRQDGSLSGYRWGVERKQELLRRERKNSDKNE